MGFPGFPLKCTPDVTGHLLASPGNSLAWDYVRSNWEHLVRRFSLNNRYLGRLPGQVASGFVSGFKRDEVEAFFEKYPEGGAGEVELRENGTSVKVKATERRLPCR